TNGTPGPYTVSDFEQQLFGLPKQYRPKADRSVRWVTSDTQYRRALSVSVGTNDARRVFSPNMTHEDYTLMGRPVSIQDDVANGATAFANLQRAYRLWRRQGLEVRWEAGGTTLVRRNTILLAARMRVGGKVVDPSAVAKMTDGDSTDG
ncbi:MAG TPA: phage major capsid protein, partial [Planctomycetaceae bacterium]|nr:phage major capsid protein [Planctomycetaceae bacterium]